MPTGGRVKHTNTQLPAAAVVADPFIVVHFCPAVIGRGGREKKSHSVRSTGEPSHGGGARRRLCSEARGTAVRRALL